MAADRYPVPPHHPRTFTGQPVRRTEDARLLTGRGCYSDDFGLPGQAYAVAYARITKIDREPATTLRA
jgi:CO/xanthine dehydrogenase Mo-binding subunit